MSIRYYHPSMIYEVTARTIAGAFFFDPAQFAAFASAFNAIVARAQARHNVRVYAYFFMSNHYHALYGADDADAMADFLCDVHGNVARFANKALGRVGPVFNGRCDVVAILPGETALPERLCYLMGQALKVHEQYDLFNWPGANTNAALLLGEALTGQHFDVHQKTLDSRLVGGPKPDEAYTTTHEVKLSPLPCWAHLAEVDLRSKYRAVGTEAVLRYSLRPDTEGGIVQMLENAQESRVTPPAPAAIAALSDEQKRQMEMARPDPPKRECNRKRPIVYADSQAETERYELAYKAICEAHAQAREELAEQTARAMLGLESYAVRFPMYTFAAVVRASSLARELGLTAQLGAAG